MHILKRYSNRLVLAFKAIRLYSNWLPVLISYLGLRNETRLVLRNDTIYEIRPKTKDFQVVNDIYMNKMYHRYLSILKRPSVAIDIGANIGTFSILAAKQHPAVKVYAFEPFAENVTMLKKNVALNKLEEQVAVFQSGIANKKGKRELSIDAENTGAHSLYGKGKKVSIAVTTLTEVFKKQKIQACDFLKIDCEGAEFEILYSAERVLRKVRTITCEFHEYFNTGNVEELVKFLEKQGFVVSLVREGRSPLGILYAHRKH